MLECNICGNNEKFYGRQTLYIDVLVNHDQEWLENVPDFLEHCEAGRPYGPFCCVDCGSEIIEKEN